LANFPFYFPVFDSFQLLLVFHGFLKLDKLTISVTALSEIVGTRENL
jgi:hypothetical protein